MIDFSKFKRVGEEAMSSPTESPVKENAVDFSKFKKIDNIHMYDADELAGLEQRQQERSRRKTFDDREAKAEQIFALEEKKRTLDSQWKAKPEEEKVGYNRDNFLKAFKGAKSLEEEVAVYENLHEGAFNEAEKPESIYLKVLAEDEGESVKKPYALKESPKSGLSMATGVDLGSKDEAWLRKAGMSEKFISDFKKALGVKGIDEKFANSFRKITKEESDLLDAQAYKDVEADLSSLGLESLTGLARDVAMTLIHQYGKGTHSKQNAYRQLIGMKLEGEFSHVDKSNLKKLIANLNNWGDTTSGLSNSINARYKRWAKRLEDENPNLGKTSSKIDWEKKE